MFPSEKWNVAIFPPITGDRFWAGVYTNAHPKEIGVDKFQILRNLVHMRKRELATRLGFHLLSDTGTTPHILLSRPLGFFRHYTEDGDKYSVVLDYASNDTRLLYKKDDNVVVASAWTRLDAAFFASGVDRVRGVELRGALWMSNGVDGMKYFVDETDYGEVGNFPPHLQPVIGTPVFAASDSETFENCGIWQHRERWVYDDDGNYSNPSPASKPYLYQWVWKEDGLQSITLTNLSTGAEFTASVADRIISKVIERRWKQFDDDVFSAWYRVDILDGVGTGSYVDNLPLITPSSIVGDYGLPPIPKYLTTAQDCLIGGNLQGALPPIPYATTSTWAALGLAKRVKISIKNNNTKTATNAIVTITDIQWGDATAGMYIDYDDTGVNAGKDFQFTDEDGVTPLPAYRSAYSAVTNTVSFVISVPEIVALEEKVIYLYYNGADCNADDALNWKNVWHREYATSQHLALFNMDSDDADTGVLTTEDIANKILDEHGTFGGTARAALTDNDCPPFNEDVSMVYDATVDGFIELQADTDYVGLDTLGITALSNFSIELWFKWNAVEPAADGTFRYLLYHGTSLITGVNGVLKIWVQHTAGGAKNIGATIYDTNGDINALIIDTVGDYDVFNGDWWKIGLIYDGTDYILRVKSVSFADSHSDASDYSPYYKLANIWNIGTAVTNAFNVSAVCFVDELSFVNYAKTANEFSADSLRQTYWANALTFSLDEPEDVSVREDIPDGIAFSLPHRPHIWSASNLVKTGFGDLKGLQYFANSIYAYHRNRVARMNLSGDNQSDWLIDYTFADKLTIPGMSITGLLAEDGLTLAKILGNEYQVWVADGGVKASAGGEILDLSEPINNIFREKSYEELQHSALVYSPKHKQMLLGLSSAYQSTTSAGAGEPVIRAVRTNENQYPMCYPQQKTFGIDNAGTVFHCVVDWATAAPPDDVVRALYKKTEGGASWALCTNPSMDISAVIASEDTKDWRSMSMVLNRAKTVLNCVTNAIHASGEHYHIVRNTYTTATSTWGTANSIIQSNELVLKPDIALDINDNYHIIYARALFSGAEHYTYYYYNSHTGTTTHLVSNLVQTNVSCSIRAFNNSEYIVTLFGHRSGSEYSKIQFWVDSSCIGTADIADFMHSCMALDSTNKVHLAGFTADSSELQYCTATLREEEVTVSEPETIVDPAIQVVADYGITVRTIRGEEVPVIFYTVDASDEIYYKTREGGRWGDATALGTSGAALTHLVVDQMPLPDNAIGDVMYAGFMDTVTTTYSVKCWQNNKYVLEQNAPAANYYIDQLWCLDLNEEVIRQNGGLEWVWSEFTAKTADGRMPLGIPCIWNGLDDNQELLFACSNAAKIFVYGERQGLKKYLDEFTSGTDLIIPISLKTADMKFYNDVFDDIRLKYRDFLRDNSLDLRVYLDGLLAKSITNYVSRSIIQLPIHLPVETLALELSGDSVYGKTTIENLEYKHLTKPL